MILKRENSLASEQNCIESLSFFCLPRDKITILFYGVIPVVPQEYFHFLIALLKKIRLRTGSIFDFLNLRKPVRLWRITRSENIFARPIKL